MASAITLLLTPVISRLYLPEHFGMSAVFLSTITIIGPSSCFAYEKAVNVARSIDDARRLVTLCVVVSILVAIVVSPIVAGLSIAGALPRTLVDLGPLLWLLPVAIVLEGAALAAGSWLLRHALYSRIAAAEVLQNGGRAGLRVLAGLGLGSTVGALVWSYVLATAAKIWVLRLSVTKDAQPAQRDSETLHPKSLVAVAREYSDFPRYNMVTGFVMRATSQLPVFVLGATFGAEVVGFLAMADRLMRAPITITTNTLRQVVLQKFSEIWNAGRPIRSQLTRTVTVLFVLGLVPLLVFWFWGEELFAFVLGDRWRMAGRFIEIMAPYFLVLFLGSPFQAATSAMRRQRLWFWLELITALARLAIIPVAAIDGVTPETIVRVYVWTTVCTKMASFAIVYFQVPRVHTGFHKE